MKPILTTADDGTQYRDLNGNGVLDPFEDPRLTPEQRTADLVGRLSLEEKVGLMFHPVIHAGPDGTLAETVVGGRPKTSDTVSGRLITHYNVHTLGGPRLGARWMNALQSLAERTPHGIPVTVSTDPRHAFVENSEVSFKASGFSQWPEPLGFAAIDDVDLVRRFAEIARQEYRAVGIRSALHPQIDLTTEPRWGRQVQCFGQDAGRASEYVRAYLEGFQVAPQLGPDSVSCITKHFPGAGPQLDGEDAHFPYGREQVYPGEMFEYHLEPFRAAIEAGTAGMMPYYAMPQGLVRNGEPIEEVGFGYNKQILTGLLRGELGYDGAIVSDWKLVMDRDMDGRVFPARAWGAEHLSARERVVKVLDAGVDQFGGEDFTDLLLTMVRDGEVTEARLDVSVSRLLLVKFRLGLFDDPFVDEDAAEELVGCSEFAAEGFRAQARSFTVLKVERDDEDVPALPIRSGQRLYVEGVDHTVAARYGTLVEHPEDADLAVIRVKAPFEARDDIPMERKFHQGSLEFPPGLRYRLRRIADRVPVVLDVELERPAVLTPLVDLATVLVGSFGGGDEAFFAALTGEVHADATLPMEIPRSMAAVRASRSDVPSDTVDPVFPVRSGVRRQVPTA
ncbi:glycoside hydrolase family 3 protein [Phycicoccus flavus]|uniref:glycoside hydrolase family 3 protein n=1 Tax=Phycicoccus flavus TaxID=2502783 RepID=UPI000FEB73F9|nr:glycoside hydrolase family 3 N-terminal domain-containing protein [Phycicoccus flavus]NHA67160.1 glycoside hydrolase family 3 protein [Phycicoccus flavus]